jgi:N-acetylglucosaminyl-diphospho-decaprenol L-rhamnosyltransferase
VNSEGLRVVILTHGSGRPWAPLLESLEREGLPLDRVVVVHNPTEPDEPRPTLPDGCELIPADRNRGYSVGMNLGLERQLERGGELVLVLTHDARFEPGSLAALVEAGRANPEYGVLGPALFLEDGTPFSAGGFTTDDGMLFHLPEAPADAGAIHDCDWVDGGTMLFRMDVMRQIGGFEERFFIYCEDAEICWRVTRTGAKVGVAVASRAEQSPGGAKRVGPWSYLLTRNGTYYAAEVRGRRGQIGATRRALRQIGLSLIRTVVRGLRIRKGPPGDTWALTVGTTRGLLDYRRGVWGPPPRLPGSGDVKNVG